MLIQRTPEFINILFIFTCIPSHHLSKSKVLSIFIAQNVQYSDRAQPNIHILIDDIQTFSNLYAITTMS